jgi:glycosyltransferase involved in cell wall biosynthesis
MKIALVTPSKKILGGVGVFNRDLTNVLESNGHKFFFCTLDDLFKEHSFRGSEEVIGEYFKEVNKRENFDIVICNGEFGYAVHHPRSINVFHGNYHDYAISVQKFITKEEFDWRMGRAKMQKKSAEKKYVVAVSEFATFGLAKSDIRVNQVIPLSVDTSIFFPEKDTPEFSMALCKGVYHEKGFDILENLAEKGIRFKFFSDRPIKHPNIDYKGFRDNTSLRKEYNSSLALLNPTRFEGGSLTTLEAMACACPVITTPTGYGWNIKDVIPEFVVSDLENIDNYVEMHKVVTKNRSLFGKKALDYFNEYHHPSKFRDTWLSLLKDF